MIEANSKQFIWAEKYRPGKIDDVVLPPRIKNVFKEFVKLGNLPNIIAFGPPGVGKTAVIQAAINELGAQYLFINGSRDGGIDTLRTDIAGFASSMSFNKKRKYVILDEADYLSQNMQAGLRGCMEEYSQGCGFILTCNYIDRIMDAIQQSRCSHVDFTFYPEERMKLSALFFNRVKDILTQENIEFDQKVLANVIKEFFPDWRRTLGELQMYSTSSGGKIDSGMLAHMKNADLEDLISLLKEKKYTAVRQWVADNKQNHQKIYDTFYNNCAKYFDVTYIPRLIIVLNEYQRDSKLVINKEICLAAMLAEIMIEAVWK